MGKKLIIQRSFRLSVDEYLTIRRKAAKAHMTLSDHVRLKLGLPASQYKPRGYKA